MIKLRKLTAPAVPFFQGGIFPIIQCGRDSNGAPLPCDLSDAEGLLLRALQFLWLFSGTVAVLIVFWSAFQFITAAGDPAKAEAARKTLVAGLWGVLIIALGYAVTRVFANAVFGTPVPIPSGVTPP